MVPILMVMSNPLVERIWGDQPKLILLQSAHSVAIVRAHACRHYDQHLQKLSGLQISAVSRMVSEPP